MINVVSTIVLLEPAVISDNMLRWFTLEYGEGFHLSFVQSLESVTGVCLKHQDSVCCLNFDLVRFQSLRWVDCWQ